jgi:hypothetical protein
VFATPALLQAAVAAMEKRVRGKDAGVAAAASRVRLGEHVASLVVAESSTPASVRPPLTTPTPAAVDAIVAAVGVAPAFVLHHVRPVAAAGRRFLSLDALCAAAAAAERAVAATLREQHDARARAAAVATVQRLLTKRVRPPQQSSSARVPPPPPPPPPSTSEITHFFAATDLSPTHLARYVDTLAAAVGGDVLPGKCTQACFFVKNVWLMLIKLLLVYSLLSFSVIFLFTFPYPYLATKHSLSFSFFFIPLLT